MLEQIHDSHQLCLPYRRVSRSGKFVPFVLTAAVAPLKVPAVAVMRMQVLTAIKMVFMAKRWLRRGEELDSSAGRYESLRCYYLQCC